MQQPMQILTSNKSVEWGTPAQYVESARVVMGGIDLDPASNEFYNQTVKADRFYTKDDDGLSRDWFGRVWLNPPYSDRPGVSLAANWARHLSRQVEIGNVSQAVLLVGSKMGYAWFEGLWRVYPTCFARERIRFINDISEQGGACKHGSAFVYFGKNVVAFHREFSRWGRVILPEGGIYDERLL